MAGLSSMAHIILTGLTETNFPKSVIFVLNGKNLITDLNAEGQSSSDESDNDDNELI